MPLSSNRVPWRKMEEHLTSALPILWINRFHRMTLHCSPFSPLFPPFLMSPCYIPLFLLLTLPPLSLVSMSPSPSLPSSPSPTGRPGCSRRPSQPPVPPHPHPSPPLNDRHWIHRTPRNTHEFLLLLFMKMKMEGETGDLHITKLHLPCPGLQCCSVSAPAPGNF